jgi:ornithine lipid hydroxylase
MVQSAVAWTLYPLLVGGALVATWSLLAAGWAPAPAALVIVFLSALPLLAAQRLWPAERAWVARPKHFGIDLLHMASTGLATDLVRALTVGFAVQAAVSVHDQVVDLASTPWPLHWPVLAQLAFGVVVGDFGAYWVHRLCHAVPLFWRLHAMHHSSERMYVFAAARNHPVNAILMHAAHLVPLTLLGAPIEILALASVFTGVNGMVQHCNVDLRFGWLNTLFATADLHRWHHSSDLEESNQNFGNNLIIWDAIFGTRYLPEGRPRAVGLGEVHLPENFVWHLVSPFLLNRLLLSGPATPDDPAGTTSDPSAPVPAP